MVKWRLLPGSSHGGFLSHGGTRSHHPFFVGIVHETDLSLAFAAWRATCFRPIYLPLGFTFRYALSLHFGSIPFAPLRAPYPFTDFCRWV